MASLMTCLAALLSAFTNLRWLLACAMMLGFVFGWHWSLMPVSAPSVACHLPDNYICEAGTSKVPLRGIPM